MYASKQADGASRELALAHTTCDHPRVIKGEAVQNALIAVENIAGRDARLAVEAALPPAERARILAARRGELYPMELIGEIHRAIQNVLGQGSTTFNYRVGIELARIDLPRLYRAVLWTLDYEQVLHRLEDAWRSLSTTGAVTFRVLENGHALGRIDGVSNFHEAMWMTLAGRVDGLLRICGAADCTVTVPRWDESSAEFDVRWTP